MAKIKTASKEACKVSFGFRKNGKAIKSRNKHDKKAVTYRGQGT